MDNPNRVLDGGTLIVNQVDFSLVHDEKLNPAAVIIYGDLGEFPPGCSATPYLDLLEANMGIDGEPVYALSYDTGRGVLTDYYPLNRKSASEQLREVLVRLAAKIVEWRKARVATGAQPGSASRGLPGLRASSLHPPARSPKPILNAAIPSGAPSIRVPADGFPIAAPPKNERVTQLIQAFYALAAPSDSAIFVQGESVTVDGVMFWLTCKEQQGSPLLRVHCDFGELPGERLADACKTLLTMNWYLYNGIDAAFSICPKSARVLFEKSYSLETLTPNILHRILTDLVVQVREWRIRHFLESLPAARKHRPEWARQQ
ncbi:CesT family type III secretion system chaperone [Herbaspirillum sp. GCM10030257]|uniref:CesT family type III secretion system chaperone n=1 Tax=Herbaspirillum sp. GCM10030257 TaxID=3273393 RepID=UPI0036078DCF